MYKNKLTSCKSHLFRQYKQHVVSFVLVLVVGMGHVIVVGAIFKELSYLFLLLLGETTSLALL